MKSLLLSFLLAIPALAFSQKEDVRAEIHFQGNAFYHEFRPYEFVGSVGYNITDRFFVNVRGESTVALFKINGLKDYYTNVMYGANVGYTFLKNDLGNFDVRIGLGDNLRRKQVSLLLLPATVRTCKEQPDHSKHTGEDP